MRNLKGISEPPKISFPLSGKKILIISPNKGISLLKLKWSPLRTFNPTTRAYLSNPTT